MTKTKMSKRHLLWIFSLFFLVCFLLTILVVLLISGDSVALFSSFSDTITLSFSAEETQNSSLQENLGLMIEDIRAAQMPTINTNHKEVHPPTHGAALLKITSKRVGQIPTVSALLTPSLTVVK